MSLGLITTVLPASRAGIACAWHRWSGKLNGPITPTTPSGWYRRCSPGATVAGESSAATAPRVSSNRFSTVWISTLASLRSLPVSSTMASASASPRAASACLKRSSTAARSATVRFAQPGCAAAAAPAASATAPTV